MSPTTGIVVANWEDLTSVETTHYISIDIHKHFVMIVGVDANHEVVLNSRRVSTKQLGDWATKYLTQTDEVIMEATTNVWVLHDLICPHVKHVTVVHPFHVKIITGSFVKTDKKDALAPLGDLYAQINREWWYAQELSPIEALRIRQDLQTIDFFPQ